MKNSTSLFGANKGFTAQLFLVLFAFFSTLNVWGQVTTNGGSGLAGTYNTLAEAITALNSATISSPVIITLTGNETAPFGGYNITKSGTSTNTITIQGSSSTITAPTPQASGILVDAIFKITGADWITIQSFTMQENAANTTTTAGSNNMTEFGVALFYATTTNGAQNCTIQNNTITLNRTYQNTFGIYSNSTHSATLMTTSASATTTAGGNSGLKIYGNTISNVNQGINVTGPIAAADLNTGLDIGGTSAGQGNSITNWGTTGTFSGYANVSGTLNCILVRNCAGYNISYNTLTSSAGGNTVTTSQRAIYVPSFSAAPTTAVTCTISNNNISVQSGLVAGTVNGIIVESTTGSALSSLTISSNNFNTMGHTAASPTGAHTYISSAMAHLNTTINNNTFTNISASTSGSITFISNAISVPTAGGTQTINGNSIVTAFAKTGAGGTVTVFSSNSSSVTGSIISMQNNNFSNITLSGSASFVGINNTDGGSPTKTISGNTFNNISGGTGSINPMTINFFGGSSSVSNNTITNINWGAAVTAITIGSSSSAASLDVNSNTINTISSTAGSVVGLSVASPSTVTNVSINAINNLSSTAAATITGISISGATTTNVFRNKIFSLSGNNTSTTINGLQISLGTSINVYNNLIGNLTASAANAANPIIGLNITGGTTINASYNSIYLDNLTSSGALFGASGIFASTTPNLTLRNNLVRITGTANGASNIAAYRRSTNTLSSYSTSSNNNLFFAGTPSATNLIYTENTSSFTNSQQTLATYKTFMSNRDQASVSENPTFQSTTGSSADFLKYNTSTPTQIESGGITVSGITTDFTGTTVRCPGGSCPGSAAAPDMGAWELNGIAADLTGPSISYTALSNTLCTNGQSLTATITDASGVNTTAGTKPRIYFKKSTDANTYVGNTSADNGWKFVESSSSTSPFSFTMDASLLQTSLAAGDVIQYFVVAQDLATVPNVGVNSGTFAAAPSSVALTSAAFALTGTINSYTINTPIPTSVTIGAAGTYTSITGTGGLFAAINAGGLSGNTVATIIDASVTETGATALNQISYACTPNVTLTIKPATGVNATISGSSSGAIIKLNGADYVTIDGSNNGTNSRNLTITNTNTGTSSAVIWLASVASPANGAINNIVKNTIVNGNATTTTLSGIISCGSTIGSVAEAPNNGNVMDNNLVSTAYFGIAIVGATATESSVVVSNNTINTIGLQAIFVSNQQSLEVSGNTVSNVTTSANINTAGIYIVGTINGGTISRNVISNIKNTATSGRQAMGIWLVSSSAASGLTISNNMIFDIANSASSATLSRSSHGIYIATGGGYNIYYNTVNLNTNPTAANTSGNNAALYVASGVTGLNIRNNIFANNQSTSVNRFAIYSDAANTAFTNINYNNYFSTGTDLGFIGSARTTLTDVITGFGGNANSMNVNPQFVSATDLHINSGSTQTQLESGGVAISGLTSDIDDQTRPGPTGSTNGGGTAPDIGADEFDGVPSLSMSYTSSTTEQVTGSAYAGVTNQSIIRVKIVTTGATSPLSLTSLTLNANGTTDIADINAATAKVYYTGTSTTFGTSSLFGATTPTVANFAVTGSQTLVEGNNYFWLAYDVASAAPSANLIDGECIDLTVGTIQTPTVSAPSGNKSILGAMSGTYAVGASQTETGSAFTKLTTAIADLNLRGVSGAVTFALQSDYTSATETFPLTINAVTGASVTNTVTIKPAATVTATISGSAASSALIKIASKYVTIDGSNTAGGTTRDLTITNTSTTTPNVILIGNSGTSTGTALTDVTLKNTTLINGVNTSYAVIVANNTSAAGYFNNITIQNNSVQKAYIGIYANATVATGNGSGLLITGNDLNTSGANAISYTGIYVQGVDGAIVSNNNIANITSSVVSPYGVVFTTGTNSGSISGNTISALSYTGTYDYAPSGIISTASTATNISINDNIISNISSSAESYNYFSTPSGIYISSINTNAYNNKIFNIKQTNTGGEQALGINLSSASTTSGISVYNNFIFDIAGYGWSSIYYNGHGIGLLSGGGYNLYNNTINMNTNQTTTTGYSAAVYISSSLATAASVNIRNNIFANTQTDGAPAANRYAIYCAAANTIFGTINHNNYYSAGTNLGYIGSTARVTLADIVTGFGGNANSVNISPTFVSSTNLHLNPSSNCTLDNKGVFIAGVTTDIDGDTRSNSTPDIGADEFTFTGTTFTWTGGANTTNPMTAGNWDLNALPSSCSNITIPGGLTYYPSYSSPNANLTINSGTTLTLQTGARFSIDGTLTNNGTLTLESGATLVQGASSTLDGTGTYNVKQDITGTNNGSAPSGRFWYLGSPVSLASSSVYFGNAANVVKKRDEVNNAWTALSIGSSENLVVGRGYYTQAMGNATINFTGGLLNNGAITIGNLTRTAGQGFEGFNLVSNPYPSYLDWDAVTKTDVGNTMWYRTASGSTAGSMVFDTYVAGTGGIGTNLNGAGVSNLVPPMQSFWVRVNSGSTSGSLGLSNSMRAHFTSINGSVAGLKSTSNERDLFLRMNLLQANKKDQIIVYVNDDATNGFDQLDGEKMMQAGMPQFYTSAAGKKITINGLNSAKKQQALPITMELPTTGVHSFVIEDLEIDNGLVWLEDKQEEIMQALEPGTVYEFYANSGINAERFVLHFQLIDNTTPINVYNEVNGSANFSGKGASVHAEAAGVVVIKLPATTEGITDIQIRDAAGKLVYTGSTNTLETSVQLVQANGIYYVTLNSTSGVEVRKVFIQQ